MIRTTVVVTKTQPQNCNILEFKTFKKDSSFCTTEDADEGYKPLGAKVWREASGRPVVDHHTGLKKP